MCVFFVEDTLHEELSRSSSNTETALANIERAYEKIINEFRDQRDQLCQNIHHTRKDIKQLRFVLRQKQINTHRLDDEQ
jgi:hypothetical protein